MTRSPTAISPRNAPTAIIPSALQKISREILSVIFVQCLPSRLSHDDMSTEPLRDSRLAPFTLASVCQEWRTIACQMTELWATCWLNFWRPELNAFWLERSGTGPLHLYGRYFQYPGEDDVDLQPLFASILPYQKRWKTLDLDLENPGVPSSPLSFDCPMLESFKLTRQRGIPHWLGSLVPGSPQLRELELENLFFGMPLFTASFHLPPPLTTLKAGRALAEEVIQILPVLPQLRHLSFCLYDSFSDPVDFPPVTHTNLASLQLQVDGARGPSQSIQTLFDKVILPSLRAINLSGSFDLRPITECIEWSKCQIREFAIGPSSMRAEDLIEFLQHHTIRLSLKKLEFNQSGLYLAPKLFRFLTYRKRNRNLPHLAQLLFRDCILESRPDGMVANVIASRRGALICECRDCCGMPGVKKVRLDYVLVDYLDKVSHILDLARLIPLPEDKVKHPKDAGLVLDLVIEPLPGPWSFQHQPNPQRVKFLISKSFNDDYI